MAREKNGTSLLRIALPPGVSLVVHALLVVLLVVVGSRLTPPAPSEKRRVVLSEIESAPAPRRQPDRGENENTRTPEQSQRPAAAASAPQALERAAASMTRATPAPASLPGVTEDTSSSSMSGLERSSGVRFAGYRAGAAGRIVYCVDVSGATASSLTYIRERLLQSIDLLSPTQKFQVVVFRDLGDDGVELAPLDASPLARATRTNKNAVGEWLAAMPAMGRSNPLAGLRAALGLEPDLVLLISRAIERTGDDPWAGGLANVRRTLDELNPMNPRTGQRPVVIKTVQLLDEDPTGIMRAIGTLHGDGGADHSVVLYEALASPDTTIADTAPGSSLPIRAAAVLDRLGSSGALTRASIGAPTRSDLKEIEPALRELRAVLAEGDHGDISTAMLSAQTALLAIAAGETPPGVPEALRSSVLVDPSADTMRRIVLAQLDAARGDRAAAVDELTTLLDERGELGIDPPRVALASVTLVALGAPPDDLESIAASAPFVVNGRRDAGWSLMLAWARASAAHNSGDPDVFEHLLALEGDAISTAQTRRAVIEMAAVAPDAPRPDRAVLILAQDALRDPRHRWGATDAVLALAHTTDDPRIRTEALWTACAGAQADARRGVLADAALALASHAPDDPRTIDALAGAVLLTDSAETDTRVAVLERAVTLGPERPERDLWALEFASLMQNPSRRRALVTSLTPNTRESDLGAELVHADALNASFPNDAAELDHARGTLALMDTLGSPLASSWERRVALLEVELDPARAVERLSAVRDPDARVSLALAEALVNAGRPSDATQTLTALVATLGEDDPAFWDAWALLIETVAAHGDADARGAARAHLARLAIIDPNFGGNDAATRLTNARRTLHSEP